MDQYQAIRFPAKIPHQTSERERPPPSRRRRWPSAARTSPAAESSIGSGPHTYELVPGWGVLQSGVKYGYTHGFQATSDNQIVVHNHSKDSVIIFDHKGKCIKS